MVSGNHSFGDVRAARKDAHTSEIQAKRSESRTESKQRRGLYGTELEKGKPETQVTLEWSGQVLTLSDRNPCSLHSKNHSILFSSAAEPFQDFAVFNRYFNRKVSEHFKCD